MLVINLLFDIWYAGSTNLKKIHRAGWTFFTTLKRNRLVRGSTDTGYQSLDSLDPPAQGWRTSLEVRLKEVPFGVKRFK